VFEDGEAVPAFQPGWVLRLTGRAVAWRRPTKINTTGSNQTIGGFWGGVRSFAPWCWGTARTPVRILEMVAQAVNS